LDESKELTMSDIDSDVRGSGHFRPRASKTSVTPEGVAAALRAAQPAGQLRAPKRAPQAEADSLRPA